MEDKILISKDILKKIQSRAITIKLVSTDRQITKEAEEILEIINVQLKENSLSLLERIDKKMKETKLSDPELNANLYILYRNLSGGKISEQDADALFELYIKSEPFNKTIY
ncbi:hypothetical protein [Clostridium lundense]|uniref:hypothetical protein n=1 Tax=Clostridium lundense TaxID=319475 RepID=UPI000484CEF7|nr:hypothetical protein [Clostridium lundense]